MKHTINGLNKILSDRGLNFLTVVAIVDDGVTLNDSYFGQYSVDLKAFTPSTKLPLHKMRKHINLLGQLRSSLVGKVMRGVTIVDVFTGKDRGYKNRGFYLDYTYPCGHGGTATKTWLMGYKKSIECTTCFGDKHGERTKIDGKLKKRTGIYIHWQRIRHELPVELQDFVTFRSIAGEKPATRCDLLFSEGKPFWKEIKQSKDQDLELIITSVRQSFRYSSFYRDCIKKAEVETESGTRYRCAHCGDLELRSKIDVDHIIPIAPLDGSVLQKHDIIDRIFTPNIQVLDHKCHVKKSAFENLTRREAKKLAKGGLSPKERRSLKK